MSAKLGTPSARNAQPSGVGGFTLIEAMVSVAMAGILTVGAFSTFSATRQSRREARYEWVAFTLAQAQLELLASTPTTHPTLADSVPDTVSVIGGPLDEQCTSGVDGQFSADMRVDELGQPRVGATYDLCWKVTAGHPFGTLRNLRVLVGYPTATGRNYVQLQTIR